MPSSSARAITLRRSAGAPFTMRPALPPQPKPISDSRSAPLTLYLTRGTSLAGLGPDGPGERRPFLDLGAHVGGEGVGVEIVRLDALGREPLAHLRRSEDGAHRAVEAGHDVARHAGRPRQAEPGDGGQVAQPQL